MTGRRSSGVRTVALTLVAAALAAAGCGPGQSAEEHALAERQKFSVDLVSWAPVGGDQLAIDVTVLVTGESDLQVLTVAVHQAGPDGGALRTDRVPLEVAGLGFDGRKSATLSVAEAAGVAAVAVEVEATPDPAHHGDYPELAGS